MNTSLTTIIQRRYFNDSFNYIWFLIVCIIYLILIHISYFRLLASATYCPFNNCICFNPLLLKYGWLTCGWNWTTILLRDEWSYHPSFGNFFAILTVVCQSFHILWIHLLILWRWSIYTFIIVTFDPFYFPDDHFFLSWRWWCFRAFLFVNIIDDWVIYSWCRHNPKSFLISSLII